MRRSPASAILWEIWSRQRDLCLALIAVTAAGRILQAIDPSALSGSLRMLSFVLLFGIFNYTESPDGRGLGRFPSRLFVLPVSTLRLVAVPVLGAVTSVVVLYLVWLDPLATGGAASVAFYATLLATLMLCYQAALWILARLGPLRLVVVGSLVVAAFLVSLLPLTATAPPPWWRTLIGLTLLMIAAGALVFAGVWRYLIWVRSGASHGAVTLRRFVPAAQSLVPRRRAAFRSAAAAHFWFEWRSSGFVLPLLTAGVVLAIVAPLSWVERHDAADTQSLLIAALAVPIVLAIPVGIGFAKPALWSDDLSIPAFVAVRPLSDEDYVATKVKVAIASAAASWFVVLAFVGVWLPLWGNLESLSRVATQLWVLHGRSNVATYGVAALMLIAGLLLSWRFLVSRLAIGLSGRRALHVASVVMLAVAVIAAIVFDAARLPGWVFADATRMTGLVWITAIAVAAKYALAALAWRRISPPYRRQYLLIWLAGTALFVTCGLLLWRIVRLFVMPAPSRLLVLIVLCALLAVPLVRVALARILLTRTRHR